MYEAIQIIYITPRVIAWSTRKGMLPQLFSIFEHFVLGETVPEKNTVARLKSSIPPIFGPPKLLGWFRHCCHNA